MKNEITVIKPEEFGLEKSQAVTIEEAFKPKIAEREILSSQYGELIKKDITSETCQEATLLRRKLVKVRTGISDIHKKQKAFYLAAGKFVDAWKNKETIPVSQMEEGLTNIETHFEKIEEAKREVIRQERYSELEKYETVYGAGDVALMGSDVWRHFVNGVKTEYEAKKEAERKAEEERIEQQKKLDLFNSRQEKLVKCNLLNVFDLLTTETTEKEFIAIIEKGEKLKAEFEAEQKRIKDENERLKKDKEIKDKRNLELRPFIIYIRDYNKTLALKESDYQKELIELGLAKKQQEDYEHEQEQKKQNELIKEREKNAKIQKELDDKKSSDQKVKDTEDLRIKQNADATRKAELAPDKERLTKWVNDMTIQDIVNDRMSKESVLIAGNIIDKFNDFQVWAKGEIEKIK